MSFFDDSSLAFLPSGAAGKDGKAYSIKPTNGTGDFTFSRGSNLAATRVGPTGLIEKGRENLLLQSNNFGTSWTLLNITQTSGQSGYDGSNDAWQSSFTAGSTRTFGQSFSQTGVITISIYVKAGTHDFIQFVTSTSPSAYVNFNISSSSGAKGTEGSGVINSSITSVGSDWYRCSMTFNNTISGTFYIWMIDSATSARASSVSTAGSIYIQDAQLEIGLAATEVIESGATTGKAGLLEDEPRFDYSGGATCPSLLLEPSRTNQFKYSEYFEFGLSSQSNVTSITTNTTETLSPEGLYNATKGVFASGWNFSDAVTSTTNVQSTTSVYVKAVNPSSNNTFRIFTGGIVSGNLTATSEWKRFDFTATSTGGSICGLFRDSSSNPAELYFYGMQTEAASYPTSYIPNHSGGTITRGVDDVNKLTGVGVTGDEFSIFLEFDLSNTPLVSNVGTYFQTFDSSNNSQQEFRFFTFGGEQVLVPYFRQDGSYAFGNGSNAVRFDGKILFRADGGGSYTMFFGFNGSSTKEVRTGLTAYTLNKIDFISQPKTNLKQLLIFNEALSDADCITLTT